MRRPLSAPCLGLSAVVLLLLLEEASSGGDNDLVAEIKISTIKNAQGLLTVDLGPSMWACVPLDKKKPWDAFFQIRRYRYKGNLKKVDLLPTPTWPIMEKMSSKKGTHIGKMCIYIRGNDHCEPPVPTEKTTTVVDELNHAYYYARRFWGHASDVRVQHELGELKKLIDGHGIKDADYEFFYLSYWPKHMKEVRYNKAKTKSIK